MDVITVIASEICEARHRAGVQDVLTTATKFSVKSSLCHWGKGGGSLRFKAPHEKFTVPFSGRGDMLNPKSSMRSLLFNCRRGGGISDLKYILQKNFSCSKNA